MQLSYRWSIPALIGFLALYGIVIAYYQNSLQPLGNALGYLARAETSQTPQELTDYVVMAKGELPESGNPVWFYPTARTDFALMQSYLDSMLSTAAYTSTLDMQSKEYIRNMQDMHSSLKTVQEDILEACFKLC